MHTAVALRNGRQGTCVNSAVSALSLKSDGSTIRHETLASVGETEGSRTCRESQIIVREHYHIRVRAWNVHANAQLRLRKKRRETQISNVHGGVWLGG